VTVDVGGSDGVDSDGLAGLARTVAKRPMLAARGGGDVDSCASAHEDDDARSQCSTCHCIFSTYATFFSSIADAHAVPPPADGAVALPPPPCERLALPAAGTGADVDTQTGGSGPPSLLLHPCTYRVGMTPPPDGSSPAGRGSGGGGSGSGGDNDGDLQLSIRRVLHTKTAGTATVLPWAGGVTDAATSRSLPSGSAVSLLAVRDGTLVMDVPAAARETTSKRGVGRSSPPASDAGDDDAAVRAGREGGDGGAGADASAPTPTPALVSSATRQPHHRHRAILQMPRSLL